MGFWSNPVEFCSCTNKLTAQQIRPTAKQRCQKEQQHLNAYLVRKASLKSELREWPKKKQNQETTTWPRWLCLLPEQMSCSHLSHKSQHNPNSGCKVLLIPSKATSQTRNPAFSVHVIVPAGGIMFLCASNSWATSHKENCYSDQPISVLSSNWQVFGIEARSKSEMWGGGKCYPHARKQ